MKTKKPLPRSRSHRSIPKAHAALALILIGLGPAIAHGQENSANPDVLKAENRASYAEMEANAHKAEMDALDQKIDVIETRVELLPEGPDRDEARRRLDALKDRRTELRKAYLASKYEQLKADVQAEYEKAAAWTREKYESVKESMTGGDHDTPAAFDARMNPAAHATLDRDTVYRASPSPDNQAEVDAALKALDAEIGRLKEHAKTMPAGEKRTILERRIEAIEDRKDDLESDFTKTRWDALVADLKREWNELSH